jgi:hypothetical protein
MLRITLLVFALLAGSNAAESDAQSQLAPNRKFMAPLNETPRYRSSVEELKRRAMYSRELEYRRSAGERILQFQSGTQLVEKLNLEIIDFLEECKRKLGKEGIKKYGVDLITDPEWLDKRRLKLVPMQSPFADQRQCRVVFDNAFYQQVLKRGRQLKLKHETKRFPTTLFVFAGIFAALCILYGILKVLCARAAAEQRDYITTSRISMV